MCVELQDNQETPNRQQSLEGRLPLRYAALQHNYEGMVVFVLQSIKESLRRASFNQTKLGHKIH